MEEPSSSEREVLLSVISPVMGLLHQNFSVSFFFQREMFLHNKCNGATEVGTTVAQARGGGGARLMKHAIETTKLAD